VGWLNTTNGSWWIVQVQPMSRDLDQSHAPRMNLKNNPQLNSRRVEYFIVSVVGWT
jgi:hypothetical protein